MATGTLGTATTTAFTSLINSGAPAPADVATIAQLIKNDLINGNPIYPGAYSTYDVLFVPNRGLLRVLPGDYVAVDPNTGWPILISALCAAGAGIVHT